MTLRDPHSGRQITTTTYFDVAFTGRKGNAVNAVVRRQELSGAEGVLWLHEKNLSEGFRTAASALDDLYWRS